LFATARRVEIYGQCDRVREVEMGFWSDQGTSLVEIGQPFDDSDGGQIVHFGEEYWYMRQRAALLPTFIFMLFILAKSSSCKLPRLDI
jgi:hypothetical protein